VGDAEVVGGLSVCIRQRGDERGGRVSDHVIGSVIFQHDDEHVVEPGAMALAASLRASGAGVAGLDAGRRERSRGQRHRSRGQHPGTHWPDPAAQNSWHIHINLPLQFLMAPSPAIFRTCSQLA